MESTLSQVRCGFCENESKDMKSCSKCHLTPYCSKQCQRQDWQRHKTWCEILQGNPALLQAGNCESRKDSKDVNGYQRLEVPNDSNPVPSEYHESKPNEPPTDSTKDVDKKESDEREHPFEVSNGKSDTNINTQPASQSGKKKRRKKNKGNGDTSPELSKCSWCSKTSSKALRCSRCESRTYCSDGCQRRDWIGGHQKTCQSIGQRSEGLKMTEKGVGNGSVKSELEGSETNECDWCKKYLESPLRCTGCGKVNYCSKACQKKDWDRQHKKDCERNLSKKSKEPEKSENLETEAEKKHVHRRIHDEDGLTNVCDWCQKYLDSPLKCSGCKKAKYCSTGCQKKDWTRQHKDNCDKTFVPKKDAKAFKETKGAMPDLDKEHEPPTSCNWCQKYVEDSLPCDGCSRVIYCSIECKNKDWFREHKKRCDGKENKNDESKSSNETSEAAEGSKDSCQNCKKKTRDVKKCARCKIALYCSKSCQRQDWSRHKNDCITVDGVIKTKEYQKAEQEEEAGARRRNVPISPLEAMARMMGLAGRPQQEAEPCMSWQKARELTRSRFPGYKVVENFDDLPGEFLWMVPQTFNKVLLAYISGHHHHFARHAVYIRDGFRNETAVMFYLDFDNPLPYFSWSQVAPGNYICIRNAIFHNFMDGSVGIRVDEAADVKILT